MNKSEYMVYHRECCDKMVDITHRKNADYTGVGDDPFKNFRKCENDGTCSVEAGFMVRISDKMSRIQSFIDKGFFEVKDESIEDTILDASNYLILMSGYIKSKKYNKDLPPPLPISGKNSIALKHSAITAEDLRMLDLSKLPPQMPDICKPKVQFMPFRPNTLDMTRY